MRNFTLVTQREEQLKMLSALKCSFFAELGTPTDWKAFSLPRDRVVMNPHHHHLSYTMGGLLAAGGLYAAYKSKSMVSLAAGVALGSTFIFGGYNIKEGNFQRGHVINVATSAILAAAMGRRYMNTGKVMPAGVLSALGTGFLLFEGWALYDLKKSN